MFEKKLLKTCNSIMNILLTKKNLKKTNIVNPFLQTQILFLQKKLLVNTFKKFTKLYNVLFFYTTKIHHLINLK